MLTKADVERITAQVLEDLTIEVEDGGFTDPNRREIKLRFRGKVISSDSFDIKQQREYEG